MSSSQCGLPPSVGRQTLQGRVWFWSLLLWSATVRTVGLWVNSCQTNENNICAHGHHVYDLRRSERGSWWATPRNVINTLLLLQLLISWCLGCEPRLQKLKHAFIPQLLISKVHLPILHAETVKEVFEVPVLLTLAPYRWWETVR